MVRAVSRSWGIGGWGRIVGVFGGVNRAEGWRKRGVVVFVKHEGERIFVCFDRGWSGSDGGDLERMGGVCGRVSWA